MRVRRRRALAVVLLIAVVIGVATLLSGSPHRRVTAADRAHVGRPRATTPHLRVSESPWVLNAPVSRAVAFSNGTGVVVAGGIATDQSTTPSVLQLEPKTTGITLFGSLPSPTHDAAGASVGGRQLVFGGGAQQVSDVVQALQPNTSATTVGHLPHPRADFSAVTIGSTAYLVGGYDGTNAALDVLATTDGATFRTVAQLPVGVRYPAVAALGSDVYVFGGESGGAASHAIQRVDTRTGQARIVGQMPQPRTEAAAVSIGTSIYLAGGRVGGVASADVLRFDPKAVRLAPAGQLPTPVADAATAVNGDTAYLVGGEAAAPVSSVMLLQQTNAAPSSQYAARMSRPFAGRMVIADRGNNRLIVVNANKQVSWTYPSAKMPPPTGGFYYPDDAFFAERGHSIVTNQEENHTIVHLGFPSGAVLWSYGHPKVSGSGAGYLNQPDDAFLLRDGSITVADAKNCRILFINAQRQPTSQIGTTGNCVHDPPRSVGYPNGDTPLADGNFLVSEINGSWITEYTPTGSLVWTVHLPIAYPSDPQQLGPDLYLCADYTKPGGIVEFTREGRIVWTYRPTSGDGMLDHPSLADRLPNGLIGVNDDYRHRVALIEPATGAIVWQYGVTDQPGTGQNLVNIPDGFDLLLPDGSTPLHVRTR